MSIVRWIPGPLLPDGSQRASRASSSKQPRQRFRRRLEVERLEDRALLTVVSLTPVKDNTLIQNSSGSRSNGAGDVFVGLNKDGHRIRRGLPAFEFDTADPRSQAFAPHRDAAWQDTAAEFDGEQVDDALALAVTAHWLRDGWATALPRVDPRDHPRRFPLRDANSEDEFEVRWVRSGW